MTENKQNKNIFSYLANFIKKEKKLFLFLLIILALILIIPRLSNSYLLEIPKTGGSIAEINIGTAPRFINPVLANTDADKDLLPFIYSSLLKRNAEGEIIPSIASVKLSEDKKVYTITIDKNITFSDEEALTADDVIFTIKKIQDPFIRSPYDVQWLSAIAEKIDDYTLTITLPSEYSQFKNTLASLYILPKHLWTDIPPTEFPFSSLNRKPIGSGPYTIENTVLDNHGKIKKYNFTKRENYHGGEIFIDNVAFYFFDDYKDYKKSLIFSDRKIVKNIFSVSSEILSEISSKKSFMDAKVTKLSSARNFGLFLNSKKNPVLENISLRKAISLAIDSENIIKNSLSGYAKNMSIHSQIPLSERINTAKKIISKDFALENENGKNILLNTRTKKAIKIKMAVLESSEFKSIAQSIKNDISKIGIDLEITTYTESELVENIVRDRNFEILLFGYQTDILNPDLYYFFHSSQISDPGINIAEFSNPDADKIILELRKNISDTERKEKIEKLQKIISLDYSYIPLYSPSFIYIMDSRIRNFKKTAINSREERFSDIANWYSQTEKVLPVFNNQK